MAQTLPKSIATVSLSGTLVEKLEAAASVGFDGVEIFEADLLAFDGSPADVRQICEGLDDTGSGVTPFQRRAGLRIAVGLESRLKPLAQGVSKPRHGARTIRPTPRRACPRARATAQCRHGGHSPGTSFALVDTGRSHSPAAGC